MSKKLVTSLYSQSSQARKLGKTIAISAQSILRGAEVLNDRGNTVAERSRSQNITVSGLVGSSLSMVLAEVFTTSELPFLLILNDKEEAAYHLNDLENLLGDQNVLFYPGSYRRPYQIEETDNANVLLRSEVLNRINSRKKPA